MGAIRITSGLSAPAVFFAKIERICDFLLSLHQNKINLMKKTLDILSLLLVLANVAISCLFYFNTKEISIPIHWTTVGQMETYGETWMILLLAGISVMVYLLMVVSEKHHVVNLPFKVKHEISARPYIDIMLAWTNFLVMLVLLYVDLAVAQYIKLSMPLLYSLIIIICIVDFYYTRKIYQCGRKKTEE